MQSFILEVDVDLVGVSDPDDRAYNRPIDLMCGVELEL
jgi:hypothetical protein